MDLEDTEVGNELEKVEEGLLDSLQYIMGSIETGNRELRNRIEELEKRVEELEEK